MFRLYHWGDTLPGKERNIRPFSSSDPYANGISGDCLKNTCDPTLILIPSRMVIK